MITSYEVSGLQKIGAHPEIWHYLGLQKNTELSGFFGDFTNSIGSLFTTSNIATVAPLVAGGVLMLNPHLRKKYALPIIGGSLGLAALGHSLTTNNATVASAVSSGVNSASTNPSLMGATITAVKKTPTSTIGTAIGSMSAAALKLYIMQKLATSARKSGVSQSQLYNQTLAYTTAHQQEFESAGYSTPNEAAAAILGMNGGNPPSSGDNPCMFIRTTSCEIKKYLPYIAIGGGILLFITMGKK